MPAIVELMPCHVFLLASSSCNAIQTSETIGMRMRAWQEHAFESSLPSLHRHKKDPIGLGDGEDILHAYRSVAGQHHAASVEVSFGKDPRD